MELRCLYFFTATVLKWHRLLEPDKYKNVIIESLKYLSHIDKIKVYGYVVMPNHVHLIWELLNLNGKELSHASFLKYTPYHNTTICVRTIRRDWAPSRWNLRQGSISFGKEIHCL